MTVLPNVDSAVIEAAKVRDYLLSRSHPVGRFKAEFFGVLGYSREEWRLLENDLREHAIRGHTEPTESTRFGQKYEVRGRIRGPNGREAELVAVWTIRSTEDVPRLVTAYPGAK